MLKPTATYKMRSTTKRMLANEVNPAKRSDLKHMMIQAELASAIRVKEKKNRNDPDPAVDNG